MALKRSRLKRGAPLKRGGSLKRTPLRRKTRLRPFNPENRARLYAKQFGGTGDQGDVCRRLLCLAWRTPLRLCRRSDPAHIKTRATGGGHVANIVPLCRFHHDEQHTIGIPAFEELHGLELQEAADRIAEEIKMRNKVNVYIAGPISSSTVTDRKLFFEVEKHLLGLGHKVVINPIKLPMLEEFDDEGSWEGHMRADISQLCRCHTIVILPGWERSRGVRLELSIALELGLKVEFWK